MQALSEASLEDVNSMWAGLGYYRRARFLLEGAQYVVQHHGGSFPKTSRELQKIPGDILGSSSPHYHAQQSGMSWRCVPIPKTSSDLRGCVLITIALSTGTQKGA